MSMSRQQQQGIFFGIGAYSSWGLFPLYWPLLKPSEATEILAHRMAWSFIAVLILLIILRHWSWMGSLLRQPRSIIILATAAIILTANWGVYIWGVNTGRVVETSLGAFMNPLVTVLLGILVLGERLSSTQWVAVGLGVIAILVLTASYGRPPWIALVMAFSLGTYGLLRKKVNVGTLEGLAIESAILFLPATGYLVILSINGHASFGHISLSHSLLLAGAGIVTMVPLLLFGATVTRLSLTTTGLMFYLTPIIQLLIGLIVFREPMPPTRLIGFIFVWMALAILIINGLRNICRDSEATRKLPLPSGGRSI